MTNKKDLNHVEPIKSQTWTPETREVRYIETEDLYPDLVYEDIGSNKGYGPCKWNNPNCSCSTAELERQAAELKVQREREALEYERKQREQEEKKRQDETERWEEENKRYLEEQRNKLPWLRDPNWRERGGQSETNWPWERSPRDPNWKAGPSNK